MATATTSGEDTFCGNKEAGGWAMVVKDGRAAFMLHSDGGYTYAWADIDLHQWYHAVGVYDGENLQLYLDGELVAEAVAGGPMTIPPNETAHNMVIGADSGPNHQPGQHAEVKVDDARLFSTPLSPAQAAALDASAFAGLRDQQAQLVSSTPADGSELTRATDFGVEWENPDVLAEGTTYALDGEAIAPGDVIGAGLSAGEHSITIEGRTVFGSPVSQTVNFVSGAIPETGGTDTGQGAGAVTLSAMATHPDGGDVSSTFYAGQADVAEGGFQGLVDELPSTLEFEYQEGAELGGAGDSLAAGPGQIAFQRFDVAVGEAADGQAVRWAGEVDPSRQVNVLVWNTATDSWDTVASGRGLSEGELVLSGELTADHLDAEGSAAVLVTGEDPFADDLANEVSDAFEDPDAYDFSIAHVTDTQYLTEGAVEQEYSPEQQAVWADAYTDIMEWIVDNADERKIEYVTHTGD
ncbi:MAG TPA: LamG domain-containing protein, partial [Beutenbergiaceae bacterium]|nr:LamG domain-containing protein [Beutenbergiaceae bacterium]